MLLRITDETGNNGNNESYIPPLCKQQNYNNIWIYYFPQIWYPTILFLRYLVSGPLIAPFALDFKKPCPINFPEANHSL